jgi:hypothetical protein
LASTVNPAPSFATLSPCDIHTVPFGLQPGEEALRIDHLHLGAAVLGTSLRRLDLSAGVLRKPLQAVADPEHGHPLLQDRRIEVGRVVLVDRARATAEDHGRRAHVLERE